MVTKAPVPARCTCTISRRWRLLLEEHAYFNGEYAMTAWRSTGEQGHVRYRQEWVDPRLEEEAETEPESSCAFRR